MISKWHLGNVLLVTIIFYTMIICKWHYHLVNVLC